MNDQTLVEERSTKRKILPTIMGLLQSIFIFQIITALVAIAIGLPIGLNNDTGFNIFYGGGFVGFGMSIVLLVSGMVVLLIGGKRLEEKMLRDMDKKFRQMLIGSITTVLLVATGGILIIAYMEEIWSFILFGIVNLLAGVAISEQILSNFEKMMRKATEKSLPVNENKLLQSRKLLIAVGAISICFAVAITIILAINSDRITIRDQIMICHFVGMMIFGIVGEITSLQMKKEWVG